MSNIVRSNDRLNEMINTGEPFPANGFKNYIINGGFDVWQRGTSFTAGGNIYTADRFKLQSSSTTDSHTRVDLGGGNYAVRMTKGSDGSYNNLFQIIENGRNRLLGKTVTVSCMARASKPISFNITVHDTSNGDMVQNPISKPVSLTTSFTKVSATFTIGSSANISYPNLRVDTFSELQVLETGDWVEVYNVQLEEGSVATPFEQRPYGLELSLCQRYYQLNNPGSKANANGSKYSADAGRVWWQFHKMRTVPTVLQPLNNETRVFENIGNGLTNGVLSGFNVADNSLTFDGVSLNSTFAGQPLAYSDVIELDAEL